ncbi:MAG: hypothetical protein ACOYBY_10230 [Dermatophilaceae bacterium]
MPHFGLYLGDPSTHLVHDTLAATSACHLEVLQGSGSAATFEPDDLAEASRCGYTPHCCAFEV